MNGEKRTVDGGQWTVPRDPFQAVLRGWRALGAVFGMPRVTVNLMQRATAENDPFYGQVVRDYYAYTRKRSRRFPWMKRDSIGVALCVLPGSFEAYFAGIEAAGRRNVKKAQRGGYRFERIDFNAHLPDVREIWQSAPVRQGAMPEYMVKGLVKPARNPPSRTNVHDYPYLGVLRDAKLAAYAGCLVSGEVCMIEQIYGHAALQEDGVTPLLIVELIRYCLGHYPRVRYVTYDNLLGASVSLRRFKRKFGFVAHRVKWVLGE